MNKTLFDHPSKITPNYKPESFKMYENSHLFKNIYFWNFFLFAVDNVPIRDTTVSFPNEL